MRKELTEIMNRERIIEESVYRRRRKRKLYQKKHIKRILPIAFVKQNPAVSTRMISFLRKKGYVKEEYITKGIKIPRIFSFEAQCEDSIICYKLIISTFMLSHYAVVLDFTDCQRMDIPNAMLLDLLLKDMNRIKQQYNTLYYGKELRKFHCVKSKHDRVNKCLYAFGLIKNVDNVNEKEGFLYLNLKTGFTRRTSYKENNKGQIITQIREFINNSLKESNVMLNVKGEHKFDKLLSEILNNAEDHSLLSEWYVNGLSFKEILDNDEPIIEFNLGILNFGFSISEGFFSSQEKNKDVMKEPDQWYNTHLIKMKPS